MAVGLPLAVPVELKSVDYKYIDKPCNKQMSGTPQILPKGWGEQLKYYNF